MKRLIAVIIIFILLIGVCVWEEISVNTYLNHIYNKTLAIQEYVEPLDSVNSPEIYTMVDDLEETWDKYEDILCFMVNHKDIAELSVEIARMKANIEANQEQDFKSSLSVILHYTSAYRHVMGISIQNVL